MKKTFAILGMGRYGQFLTDALCKQGADVLIADASEDALNRFSSRVSAAVVANLEVPEAIRNIGLNDVDTVIVAMGSSLEASIMCVMIAKELGVRYVIAKAASLRMGDILRRVGADEIVYPEKESAELTARRLTSSDFLDFFDLGDELCVFGMRPKRDWIGRSLLELRLRDRFRLNVVAIRRDGKTTASVDPGAPLTEKDELYIVTERDNLDRLRLR